ncbi:hypothetical protein HD592_001685 [Schaalia hyovaginalis]|uniref:Uncharacterized protein n=1 Tax=Schaalia hyovaginalis TaxID=29316 RepID=A0A923IYF1_9ACTO|nr:hypothetical protein [Schaalia hyovaginalis]
MVAVSAPSALVYGIFGISHALSRSTIPWKSLGISCSPGAAAESGRRRLGTPTTCRSAASSPGGRLVSPRIRLASCPMCAGLEGRLGPCRPVFSRRPCVAVRGAIASSCAWRHCPVSELGRSPGCVLMTLWMISAGVRWWFVERVGSFASFPFPRGSLPRLSVRVRAAADGHSPRSTAAIYRLLTSPSLERRPFRLRGLFTHCGTDSRPPPIGLSATSSPSSAFLGTPRSKRLNAMPSLLTMLFVGLWRPLISLLSNTERV